MDVVSAKVLSISALVFGLIFIVTSAIRLFRPDLDVVLVILNTALGILLLYAGVRLWHFARRGAKRDQINASDPTGRGTCEFGAFFFFLGLAAIATAPFTAGGSVAVFSFGLLGTVGGGNRHC